VLVPDGWCWYGQSARIRSAEIIRRSDADHTEAVMKFLFDDESFSFETPQLVEKALTGALTTLVTLTSAEGAAEHTHAGALGRAHPVIFDWLDTTLAR
jgi:hypothetical protein